jgi:alkylhydroperoxidase/carboxymuconolactone decarboxylase family protein YurZ
MNPLVNLTARDGRGPDHGGKKDTMSDRPLRDTILDMTAASFTNTSLPDREVMLARIAALAAVDAPPSSYLMNLAVAQDLGLTLEDVQGILVAIAPITGGPKVVTATGAILSALGFAIDLLEDEEVGADRAAVTAG